MPPAFQAGVKRQYQTLETHLTDLNIRIESLISLCKPLPRIASKTHGKRRRILQRARRLPRDIQLNNVARADI